MKKWCFVILIFIYQNINAQVKSDLEQNLSLQVKQLSEFINRFNYDLDFNSQPIDSIFKTKISRKIYLKALFNQSDARLVISSNPYALLTDQFIDSVVANNYRINKNYQQIKAKAHSLIKRNGVSDTIDIYLFRESLGYGMYKWVITDVKDDYYFFQSSDTTGQTFLSPVSNETNFIALQRVLKDREQLMAYTPDGFTLDNLSLFIYDLYNKNIVFEHVIELTYFINDIPGWEVRVKEFTRNTCNSGWLIDDIKIVY